eukprot:7441710-Karenia_brevis.AAC.1
MTSSANMAKAIQQSPKQRPSERARHEARRGCKCQERVEQKFLMLSSLPCLHPRWHDTSGARVLS